MNENIRHLLKIINNSTITNAWEETEKAFQTERVYYQKVARGKTPVFTKYETVAFRLPWLVKQYTEFLQIYNENIKSKQRREKKEATMQEKIKRLSSPFPNKIGIIESESKRAFTRGYLTKEAELLHVSKKEMTREILKRNAMLLLGKELLVLTRIYEENTYWQPHPPDARARRSDLVRVRLPHQKIPRTAEGWMCKCPNEKCGFELRDPKSLCPVILCPKCKTRLKRVPIPREG